MNRVRSASAIHFPGRRKTEKGGKPQKVHGGGKSTALLQRLPPAAGRAPRRRRRGGGGEGARSPRQPLGSPPARSRPVPPGGRSSFLLPVSSSSRLRGESSLPRIPDETPHRPRSVCRGLTRRTAGPGARAAAALAPAPGGCGYSAARARPMVGVAGRGSAPRRADSRSPPSAAPRLPTSWRGAGGGLRGSGFRGHGRLLLPLLQAPGLRASFPDEAQEEGLVPPLRRAEAAAARLAATPFLSVPPLPRLPGLARSHPGLREAPPAPAARAGLRRAAAPGSNMAATGTSAPASHRPPPNPEPESESESAGPAGVGPAAARSRAEAPAGRGPGRGWLHPRREGGGRRGRGRGRRDVERRDAGGRAEASRADRKRASLGALGAPPAPHVCSGGGGG